MMTLSALGVVGYNKTDTQTVLRMPEGLIMHGYMHVHKNWHEVCDELPAAST